MSRDRDTKIALFIDFDNVALGARDANQRFDTKILMQRILEKGKILVKKAYADWHFYKEHMVPLHENAIELIEIPTPRISGKNSADIKLVVDAMELCYSKDHIDTFVIVSGDSDFSPLVSKLRENNKRVIGVGVKNSSSKLLINNCDEFIFYDNIFRDAVGMPHRSVSNVPADKREMFEFLVNTVHGLLQESRGVLYSSLIKDTMTRKMPDFNERNFGYSTFGDLLDDSRRRGLLVVERDQQAGGTWVVQALGDGKPLENEEGAPTRPSSRRRRRSGSRGRSTGADRVANDDGETKAPDQAQADHQAQNQNEPVGVTKTAVESTDRKHAQSSPARGLPEAKGPDNRSTRQPSRKKVTKKSTPQKTAPNKKTPTTKKTTTKKMTAKKPISQKPTSPKPPTNKKSVTKKSPSKKPTTKKSPSKKAPTKKTITKKSPARKITPKKPQSGKPQNPRPTTKKTGIRKKKK